MIGFLLVLLCVSAIYSSYLYRGREELRERLAEIGKINRDLAFELNTLRNAFVFEVSAEQPDNFLELADLRLRNKQLEEQNAIIAAELSTAYRSNSALRGQITKAKASSIGRKGSK